MIDKEKVREAVEFIRKKENWEKLVGQFDFATAENIRNLLQLAELFIAGKLVEPMGEDVIEKIISETNVFILPNERKKLAEALCGKIGKGEK